MTTELAMWKKALGALALSLAVGCGTGVEAPTNPEGTPATDDRPADVATAAEGEEEFEIKESAVSGWIEWRVCSYRGPLGLNDPSYANSVSAVEACVTNPYGTESCYQYGRYAVQTKTRFCSPWLQGPTGSYWYKDFWNYDAWGWYHIISARYYCDSYQCYRR